MIIMYHGICLTLSLKSCKEDAFRTSFGNEFHSLGAEYEKDLSNIDVSRFVSRNSVENYYFYADQKTADWTALLHLP